MAGDDFYINVWKGTYGDTMPGMFCDDIEPVDVPFSKFALSDLRCRLNDLAGTDSRAVKIQMFLLNGKPYGEVYSIWDSEGSDKGFPRPDLEKGVGIMSYLARELGGRLLKDPMDTKWMVVVELK